jgi:23S rRNA pseudouridine2605 synthase
VRLNGSVQHDPEKPVRLDSDRVVVDEHEARLEEKIYLMMNKPGGLVTTASDEKGRDTVYSVLASSGELLPWVAPVGRLDKASEGLLLLTNDSEWGARVAAPGTHLEKTYHVQIATIASDSMIAAMLKGVSIDGQIVRAKECRLLRSGGKNCWLAITLEEGKNRQIRRMLASLGVEVLRLLRVSIGPLQLGTLAKGRYRWLSAEEKLALDRAMKKRSNSVHGR